VQTTELDQIITEIWFAFYRISWRSCHLFADAPIQKSALLQTNI